MENFTLTSQNLVSQLSDYLSEPQERLSPVLDFIEMQLVNAVSKQAQSSIGFVGIQRQLSEDFFRESDLENNVLDELATAGDKLMGRMLPGKKSGMVQAVMSHSKFRISTTTFLIGVAVCHLVKYLYQQTETKNWSDAALQEFLIEMHQLEHA